MHLRRVISENLCEINVEIVAEELADLISRKQRSCHKHLVLECTNLPPYKMRLKTETELGITDILTCIETVQSGTIRTEFLTQPLVISSVKYHLSNRLHSNERSICCVHLFVADWNYKNASSR